MRVALAGVLVAAPPLLLLDEPSAALDPPGKAGLARLLAELPSAMVIATHDLSFAEATCTRRVVMAAGTILADSSRGDAILL
jgi:energy-coupling factor transporter ATP-binding protein EcfA2